VLTKVGVRRVLEVNSKLIADATGKPVAIHAIARDITERKEAKRAEAHIAVALVQRFMVIHNDLASDWK
jgi:hypothetical protein